MKIAQSLIPMGISEEEIKAIRRVLEKHTSLRLSAESGREHVLYAFHKMGLDPIEAEEVLKDILRDYRDAKERPSHS